MDAQADLSLRWVYRLFFWFCLAAAHIIMILSIKTDRFGQTVKTVKPRSDREHHPELRSSPIRVDAGAILYASFGYIYGKPNLLKF